MSDNYVSVLNDTLVKINKNKPFLTGETNLIITKEELEKRINAINPGFIEVLECEHRILERQGLIHGYFSKGDIMFDIPDWDRFIVAVNAFNVSYQPPKD